MRARNAISTVYANLSSDIGQYTECGAYFTASGTIY